MPLTTLSGQSPTPLVLGGLPDQPRGLVPRALEGGINAFFFYSLNQKAFVADLCEVVQESRERVLIASGTGRRSHSGVVDDVERIRERLGVEQLDVFFAEYVSPADEKASIFDSEGVLQALGSLKAAGTIRYAGASAHDRDLAVRLVEDGRIDVLMHRYNMAHRKSQQSVLPAAKNAGVPVWAFTATRWGSLLEGHDEWSGPAPSAAECYRYSLSHNAVASVLTAPLSLAELGATLAAMRHEPLSEEVLTRWNAYGDLVYGDGHSRFETAWP